MSTFSSIFKDSDYQLLTQHESSNGFGVRILIRRSERSQKLVDALRKDRLPTEQFSPSEHENHALDAYTHASAIMKALDAQEERLDPATAGFAAEKRARFIQAFEDAGLPACYVKEIPNPSGYGSLTSPGFQVTTAMGHFDLWWRKSVIHLGWGKTDLRVKYEYRDHEYRIPTGEELFPNEDVTRMEDGIHCRGYAKLTEYLKHLASLPLFPDLVKVKRK